ncbi:MAG: trypsin-like peptidase domain-containing protein [Thaumarchaeota archaeon]|nr:trypsin-like peptidase domain-containing protein [Nitrososphaerota archaeon]
MRKIFGAILVTLALMSAAYAQMTPKEAASHLEKSVVAMQKTWSDPFCTGFKIDTKVFLTAAHCASDVNNDTRLTSKYSEKYQFIRSVLRTTQEKKDGDRVEDWAIMNTVEENDELSALVLACDEEIYLGMPIAYAGYPAPMDFAFGIGTVMSLNKVKNRSNDLDFVVDLQAAPGASGSPIISLDTGNVIGILTEGVYASRAGAFGVGIEGIANLDLCEDLFKTNGAKAPDLPNLYDPF